MHLPRLGIIPCENTNRRWSSLFHFNRKIMISQKEICSIWNCTVKVKSEFSGLHVREITMQTSVVCSFLYESIVLVVR